MADFKFQLIKDNSDELRNLVASDAEQALKACGLRAEEIAAGLCPVDTGLLRNSITFALDGESTNKSYYVADREKGNAGKQSGTYEGVAPKEESKNVRSVTIGTNVEYAPFVELGSARRTPKPFLKPAVENNKGEYIEIIKKYCKNK